MLLYLNITTSLKFILQDLHDRLIKVQSIPVRLPYLKTVINCLKRHKLVDTGINLCDI